MYVGKHVCMYLCMYVMYVLYKIKYYFGNQNPGNLETPPGFHGELDMLRPSRCWLARSGLRRFASELGS